MFVIWCTWIITIIFRFNFRGLTVSKFNFLTRVLSIVARLVEESRATFHFDNWDVHIKSCTNVFICFLLKYPKVKRIASSWSHLPKHLIFDLAGQVQAAAIISSNFLINWTYNKIITFVFHWRFYFRMNQGRSESTSSVAFEVLIINCHIEFINLFIFNCLTSNINLFIFNCPTSNFCFPKKHIFQKQKRTAAYGHASLVLGFKLPLENGGLLSSRYR